MKSASQFRDQRKILACLLREWECFAVFLELVYSSQAKLVTEHVITLKIKYTMTRFKVHGTTYKEKMGGWLAEKCLFCWYINL